MDRQIVYPGAIPLDTDLLSVQRNMMIAHGFLALAVLGSGPVVNGLACNPTSPASMQVTVGPGIMASMQVVDALAFGSLPADTTDALMKVGVNLTSTSFTLTAPTTSGDSINYLIEAAFSEADADPVVLPYYNASNPAVSYSGPANSGAAQNTQRQQRVALTLKPGTAAPTNTQTTPAVDNNNVGLWVITAAYGASSIVAANIAQYSAAPIIPFALPQLRPGFGSGVAAFNVGTSTWTVPSGVAAIEAEIWAGGSGSWASTPTLPGGGGSGGGYSRKRILVTPGQVVTVVVGGAGNGGTVSPAAAPTAGGNSSLSVAGTVVISATGGQVNTTTTVTQPTSGNLGGVGSGGDLNLAGGDGGNGDAPIGYGGMGGDGPLSGGQANSGTFGRGGYFPGGGSGGAGTAPGNTAYNGGNGAAGYCLIRW